jgi:organic radical activating enzyme
MTSTAASETEPLLKVSEIFDSIQGEGASAGTPCTFLRLAGCNLSCSWCDTPYTWDWKRFDRNQEITRRTLAEVAARIGDAPRLVVTGGEPLLQQRTLAQLFELLPATLPIEVETNGTIVPSAPLLHRIQQWNVSPKMKNSGESLERRFKFEALSALRASGRAWLKLVVAGEHDVAEAMRLASELEWDRTRVLLMPLADTREVLHELLPQVQRLAAANGVGASSRLHVELWSGKRGF